MLVLVFHLGKDRYGLPTARIEQVLPLLECKQIPGAPPWVAGLADYHGKAIPVLDLGMLATGSHAAERFDTRIVLVAHCARAGPAELLGLVVEKVTGVERIDENTLCEPGITATEETRWLGKVTTAHGMLQVVEVEHLLPEHVRPLLYPQTSQAC